MLKYIFIGLILLIIFPLVFFSISKEKKDATNLVKYKGALKSLVIGFVCFLIIITVVASIVEKRDETFPYMFAFSLFLIILFGGLANVVLSFKLEVFDNYFIFRDFLWRKKKYYYNEITGIKRRKGNSFIVCYVVLIGRKKIELSNSMINFKIIDKKLRKEGIFRRFRHQK